MSSVIQTIESEAAKVIEEAKRKAQKIVEEAKAKAKEILEDKGYLRELEEYRMGVEARLREEIDKIVRDAQVEAEVLRRSGSKKAEAIAKKIASVVAGIES